MTSKPLDCSAEQASEKLRDSAPPVLLDCREPDEWNHCRIEGAVHIPMNDIPSRINELDPDAAIIVYCHHGIRSASVCAYLRNMDFDNVLNLRGGIEAWSLTVDSNVALY